MTILTSENMGLVFGFICLVLLENEAIIDSIGSPCSKRIENSQAA